MSRRSFPLLALLALGVSACAGHRPVPKPEVFPPTPAWKTLLGEPVVAPLAADAQHLYVATRDGSVRALDPSTGAELWKAEGLPGRLGAQDGIVLVRDESGVLTSLQPRTGGVRWRTETGVQGTLAPVLDRDRAIVAGQGVVAVSLETGAVAWSDSSGAETTAPPVAAASRLLTGEKDGTLRCRDRESGRSLWTLATRQQLLAPPLVDEARARLYLGTTDRRILEVHLDSGRPGWSWRVGADVADAGLLQPGRVLFASYDAVLYALARGGNLAWRGVLPSRPASGPLALDGRVLVACLENQIVALDAATGALIGSLKTPAEIRTAPILAGGLLVLGMRDRSVIAYTFTAEKAPEASPTEPVEPAPPRR